MDATLRLVSREIDEKDLALRFDGGRWESMGDAALYRTTSERLEVAEALQDLGGEANASDIAALLDKRANTITRLLLNMEKDGLVTKTRYGVYALLLDPPNSGNTVIPTITTMTDSDPATLIPLFNETPTTTPPFSPSPSTITTMRGGESGKNLEEVTSPCPRCHHPIPGAHRHNCPPEEDPW